MAFKRKAVKIIRKKVYKKKAPAKTAASVRAIVKKELKKVQEIKKSNYSSSDGIECGHNGFVQLDSQLLSTSQGGGDPSNNIQAQNRIGDEIVFKGLQIKLMLELNERYTDVSYRIMLVKSARGDNPNTSGLFWNGLSGNKMLDTVNTERYTIIFSKWGKIKAGNSGAQTASTGGLLGGGLFDAGGTNVRLYSRATKIESFNLSPKLMKLGKITYDNSGTARKFFDYNLVIYAYSNYSTSELLGFNVLRVNDYVRTMYFTDS
jgi:hypothetical protein